MATIMKDKNIVYDPGIRQISLWELNQTARILLSAIFGCSGYHILRSQRMAKEFFYDVQCLFATAKSGQILYNVKLALEQN